MKLTIKAAIILLLPMLFISCLTAQKKETHSVNNSLIKYSECFTFERSKGYDYVKVINPWDTTRLLNAYVLVHKDSLVPDNLPEGKLIRIPINRVAIYSAVDAGVLWMIGELDKIVAVCDYQYIAMDQILQGVNNGTIIDIGTTEKPNVEKIVLSGSEIIFTTPYKDKNYGLIEQLGIPLAECANYMEKTPLGRSEWIKFYAAFFDKYTYADSLFNAIETRYNDLSKVVGMQNKHPKLIVEKRYGQVWYVPGGGSYAAKLYNDAGGFYPWKEDNSTGSLALSFEEVFAKASDADVWVLRYFKQNEDMTLEELEKEYSSYSSFNSFKSGNVYGCNTAITPYYILAPLNPDKELQDLAKIFYPDMFEDVQFSYYKKIK